MNNIQPEDFFNVMDKIGCEYADLSKKHKMALLYSGGVDSTALLLSLVKNNAKITVLHWRFFDPPTDYGVFCERMATHLTRRYNLPLLLISTGTQDSRVWYKTAADLGYHHLISGEGMDRIYLEYFFEDGSSRQWGHGEVFRAYHPFIEMFGFYMPNRLITYGKPNTHRADDEEHEKDRANAHAAGIKQLYFYSCHPLMIQLFQRYHEDVGDIFFRKRLTEMYVKKELGQSFSNLVREVYRLNHCRFQPIWKRFFMLQEEKKKKQQPDPSLKNASC